MAFSPALQCFQHHQRHQVGHLIINFFQLILKSTKAHSGKRYQNQECHMDTDGPLAWLGHECEGSRPVCDFLGQSHAEKGFGGLSAPTGKGAADHTPVAITAHSGTAGS